MKECNDFVITNVFVQDTQHSAMSVVTRLCGKMEPTDESIPNHTQALGELLGHDDPKVRREDRREWEGWSLPSWSVNDSLEEKCAL